MRREDPMAWCDGGQYKGYWSITRYEDIMTYNRNTQLLSSAKGIRIEEQSYEEYLARRTFQETDPPEHTRTRMRVSKAFSKPVIARYEETVRSLCQQTLERAFAEREFDAASMISRELPILILSILIFCWTRTTPIYSGLCLSGRRQVPHSSIYAKKLMEKCKACGADEGILDLFFKPDNSKVISDIEFRNFFYLLVAAVGEDLVGNLAVIKRDEICKTANFNHQQLRDFYIYFI